MTSKQEKLYRAIMRGKVSNVKFSDLERLLLALGFVKDPAKTGSHVKFFHTKYPDLFINLQPRGGQVKEYQVREVRKKLEELERREKNK